MGKQNFKGNTMEPLRYTFFIILGHLWTNPPFPPKMYVFWPKYPESTKSYFWQNLVSYFSMTNSIYKYICVLTWDYHPVLCVELYNINISRDTEEILFFQCHYVSYWEYFNSEENNFSVRAPSGECAYFGCKIIS